MSPLSRLRALVADRYALLFARPQFARFNKALVYLGSRGLGLYNLSSSRISGEDAFLASLKNEGLRTIIDVGANEGEYVSASRHYFPSARIIAFEPHPKTFRRLKERCGETAECFNLALDSTPGKKVLYDLEGTEGTQLASINREAVALPDRKVSSVIIEATTLDAFCLSASIAQVDLLKLDTEGSERAILQGCRRLIAEKRIRWIQFEFNEMNVASRSFLRDFEELLPEHELWRLLPDGRLNVTQYSLFYREMFGYQNIIAKPKS